MSTHNNTNCGIRESQNGCRVTLEQLQVLPLYYRETIPADYIDAMGHMNVRWYMALYDQATWHFFETLGMTADYFQTSRAGAFALRQFLNYFSEIQEGQTVALRTRVLGRTDKRFHFMHFMINESSNQLASVFESMGTHADLEKRRSAPFPDFIANALDGALKRDQGLGWDAPVSGVLNL